MPSGGKREGAGRKPRPFAYKQTSVDIRSDLLKFLDDLPENWRESIEEALIDFKAKKENEKMAKTAALGAILEKFLASDDFKSGVISSTKASWSGGAYSVELSPETYQVLWNNQIGSLYKTSGVILGLPALDTEDMTEYVEGGAGDVDDFLASQFESEEEELKEELRNALE